MHESESTACGVKFCKEKVVASLNNPSVFIFFAQGQQVDNVVEGITWEYQLQDYYDCTHF